MSDFKSKLLNELIIPNQQNNKLTKLVAEITDNKNAPKYTIKFINEKGEPITRENVEVATSGSETAGAYAPAVGSSVIVEYSDDIYTIIGSCQDAGALKQNRALKSDIYPNLIYDFLPGTL